MRRLTTPDLEEPSTYMFVSIMTRYQRKPNESFVRYIETHTKVLDALVIRDSVRSARQSISRLLLKSLLISYAIGLATDHLLVVGSPKARIVAPDPKISVALGSLLTLSTALLK